MSARVMQITPKSLEEMEALHDKAIELSKAEKVDVVVNQTLKLPKNAKCVCNSGRKWKNCCMWEASTTVTFYHAKPPVRKQKPRVAGIAALSMIEAFMHGLSIDLRD